MGCLLLFLLSLPAVLLPSPARAAADARARIDIYEQYGLEDGRGDTGSPWDYRYGHDPFLLTGGRTDVTGHVGRSNWYGKPNCRAQGGCCLFAHAHAIEWREGRRLGDGIRRQLLGVCVSPSNAYGHAYSGCHHTGKSYDAYTAYARTRGMETAYLGTTLERSALRSGFCEGNVYVAALPDGSHYVCAVDYVIADRNGKIIEDDGTSPVPSGGAFYVQIIDSCPYASAQGSGRFGGRIYELYSDNQLVQRTGQFSMYCGASYFVKTDSLTVCTSLSKKASWPGHLWKNRVCTVTFDANGGLDAPEEQRGPYGEAVMLTEKKPSRFGYRFLGWAENAGAAEADHAPGEEYLAWGDSTLYAVWSPMAVLRLPEGLAFLGEEAFAGTGAECVICPPGLESIGPRAFADCPGLRQILIPESVTLIDETAFENCGGETEIWAPSGSEAAGFAEGRIGFTFRGID